MRRFLLAFVLLALALPASAAAGLHGFRSPSGNIACAQEGARLRCDILATTNGRPRRPAACHFDWGYAYATRRGWHRGRRLCVSDTVNDPALPVLAYGHGWTGAGVRCRSRVAGITCTNPAGHGFFLSKARQRLF
jgi:hypothetical protein